MDREPVPVGRALAGCAVIALIGIVAVLLVRPAIFTFAPARDDSVVTVATTAEVTTGGAGRHTVVLSRSYGWDGERDAGDGHVQLDVIVAPSSAGGISTVAAASPVADDCPIEIDAARLVDCDGRAWGFDGQPLDPADPPLDRFPARIEMGTVVVDFTRTLDD